MKGGFYLKIIQHTGRLIRKFIFYILADIRLPFKTKSLLIIKLDAIGDYLLFRNYLSVIQQSKKFQGYKVCFLGNVAYKDFAEHFDAEYVDEFLWVNPAIVNQGGATYFFPMKLLALMIKLKLKAFDVVIHPSDSRNEDLDNFIRVTGAKRKIGNRGEDFFYKIKSDKQRGDSFYTQLIDSEGLDQFEFYRNELFVSKLLEEDISHVNFGLPPLVVDRKNKVVIFPGAGQPYRRWHPKKFATVINALSQLDNNICFVIAGGVEDDELAKQIMSNCTAARLENLTGKTSLIELAAFFQSSRLLISNETGAVHLAASLNTAAICISNGNHYRRFNPYPLELADSIITIYPDERFYQSEYVSTLVDETKIKSPYDINLIAAETVISIAEKMLA